MTAMIANGVVLNKKAQRKMRQASAGKKVEVEGGSAPALPASTPTQPITATPEAPVGTPAAPMLDLVALRAAKAELAAQIRLAAEAAKAAKGPRLAGVQAGIKSRNYYAGVVLAKHGLANGITPAMIAEVDTLCGKAIPRESSFSLRNAYHAISGYLQAQADAGNAAE